MQESQRHQALQLRLRRQVSPGQVGQHRDSNSSSSSCTTRLAVTAAKGAPQAQASRRLLVWLAKTQEALLANETTNNETTAQNNSVHIRVQRRREAAAQG